MSAILTVIGRNKMAMALANETALDLSHIALGSADRHPTGGESALTDEVYRDVITRQGLADGQPNVAFYEMVVPEVGTEPGFNYGPWLAHEYGLFDVDGDLIAIGRFASPLAKPDPAAEPRGFLISIELAVDNIDALNLSYQATANLPWATDAQAADPTTESRILEVRQAHDLFGLKDAPITLDRRLRPDFRSAEDFANDPPVAAVAGQTWIVGLNPTGAWTGHANELAEWSGTGWTFVAPTPWMHIGRADLTDWRWDHMAGDWVLWEATETLVGPIALGRLWITSNVTYAINAGGDGDFADLNAALAFLATRLIAEGATVTLQLDAGVHSYAADILIRHVHGHRIQIRGATMTGADPVLSDFATTGHSAPDRAADAATNLAMLQTKFASEIHLTGGAQVRVEDCGLGLLDDVLIRGDGTVAYGVVLRSADKVVVGTVSVHGFGDDNVYARASTIQLVGTLTASGGLQDGLELNNSKLFCDGENSADPLSGLVVAVGNGSAGVDLAASEVTISEAACHCNGSDGLFGAHASSCFLRRADIDRNGGHGVRFTNGGSATFSTGPSVLSNNGEAGVFAGHCSAVDIGPATWSGNGTFGGVARGGSFIDGTAETGGNGGASGWSSPTSNTVGNLNAFVAF